MSLENIPPVIAALDCEHIEGVYDLVQALDVDELDPTKLGFKIPHWFDQNQALLHDLISSGHYVILDTQIVNAAEKMKIATRAFLRGKIILPHAITIAPALRPSDSDMKIVHNEIVPTAKEQGVQVIGFAEQTDSDTGSDNSVMHEVRRYINGRYAGFSGHEVHAANLISPKFNEEINLSVAATYIPKDKDGGNGEDEWPDLVVSKFNVPAPRPHVVSRVRANTTATPSLDAQERSAIIAGSIFAIDERVSSVYLGSSIIKNDNPVGFILKVLAYKDAALQQEPEAIRQELQSI